MSSQSFRIFRATGSDGFSVDTHAKFVFEPALESDELFDALRGSYPHLKTHAERKRQAVLDFLVQEREDDLRALDRMVSGESTSPVQSWSSARTHSVDQTPATVSFDSFSPTNTSAHASPVAITPNFKASDSASTTSTNPAFHVWNSSSNRPVKLHKRRCMTDQEKEEYRQRRIIGSCDSCKQKRRKCRHYEIAASEAAAKGRSSKRTKSSKTSASSRAPAASKAASTSSGSSPSEAATQSYNPSPAMPTNFSMDEFNLTFDSEMPGQLFDGDFSLFAEPTEPDFFNTIMDQPFHQTPDFFPSFDNTLHTTTDYTPNPMTNTHLNNTDWLSEPLADNFLDFSSSSTNLASSSNIQSNSNSDLSRPHLTTTAISHVGPILTSGRQLRSPIQESTRSSPLSDGGVPLFDESNTMSIPINHSPRTQASPFGGEGATVDLSSNIPGDVAHAESTRSSSMRQNGAVASGVTADFARIRYRGENTSLHEEDRNLSYIEDNVSAEHNLTARDPLNEGLCKTGSSAASASLGPDLLSPLLATSSSSTSAASSTMLRASSSGPVHSRPHPALSNTSPCPPTPGLMGSETATNDSSELRHHRHPLSTESGRNANSHARQAATPGNAETKNKPALPVPLPTTPLPPTPTPMLQASIPVQRPSGYLECKEIGSSNIGLACTPFITSTDCASSSSMSALSWFCLSVAQAQACVQSTLSLMFMALNVREDIQGSLSDEDGMPQWCTRYGQWNTGCLSTQAVSAF